MKKFTFNKFLFIFFTFFFINSFSQENCNNGIDDDGDGLIDCQDFDCANFSLCRVQTDCALPYVYWMPPVWGDKVADANLFGRDDLIVTTLGGTATVKIYQADQTTLITTLIVPLALPQTYVFPDTAVGFNQVMTNLINTIQSNSGLYITSDQPIQIVYRLLSRPGFNTYNQDLMQLFGNDAPGYSFYAASQTSNRASTSTIERHFVSIIATENSTPVTITAPVGMTMEGSTNYTLLNEVGALSNWTGSRVINLNKGQTYQVLTSSENPNRTISGLLVTSTKPIVVNSGSQHTGSALPGANDRDAGFQQVLPVKNYGVDYGVVDGGNTSNEGIDYVVLQGTKSNTTVNITGTVYNIPDDVAVAGTPPAVVSPIVLGVGEVRTLYLNNTNYQTYRFQGDKPFGVFHVSSRVEDELGMEQVPPLDLCIGSKRIEFIKPNTNVNAIIYCPTSGLNTLRVNGQLYTALALNISGLLATPIGTSGYSSVVIPNTAIPAAPALSRITADVKFHVATNGYTGGTGNYVFYSDYAKNTELIDPITGQPTSSFNAGTVQVGVPKETCLTFSSCATRAT